MKICSTCKIEKENINFYSSKFTLDGFKYECKICTKQHVKKYYLKNKDKIQRVAKIWKKNNTEKIKNYRRVSYIRNKEKENLQNKNYQIKHFFSTRQRIMIDKRYPDLNKNLPTKLELAKLWHKQKGLCAVTKLPLRNKKTKEVYAQLDHIIPKSRGGTNDIKNLRWVLAKVNKAKNDMLDSELLELCKIIVYNNNREIFNVN